jgi:hypothetical protein
MKQRLSYILIALVVGLGCGVGLLFGADEISSVGEIVVKKGNLVVTRKSGTIKSDMSGDAISDNVQSIQSNAWELLTITAGVNTNGRCYAQCLETNVLHYVDVAALLTVGGTNYYQPLMRLKGGNEPNVLRLHPTNTYYATASTTWTNAAVTDFWIRFLVVAD